MRRALALVGLALVLALTACTGLPTSGYVNPGRGPQVDDPGGCAHEVADVSVVPDRHDDAIASGDRGRRLG